MKKSIKVLSLVLSLLMFVYSVPTIVFASAFEEEVSAASDTVTKYDLENNGQGEEGITEDLIYEEIILREESTKHFKLDDGSYIAAQYTYPVHVKGNDGSWVDIDNTLLASGNDFATSNARIKFAKKTAGNETLFTLHDGNYKITLSLNGANKKIDGIVTNNSDAESSTALQKLMNLEKLSSSILYSDILDGVDLEYVVNSLNVKENIIIKEKQDNYSYSFTLKLNNLEAELRDSGDIRIFDPETNVSVYNIPAPIVYDAQNTYAAASSSYYTLLDNGNGSYTLTVTADSEWINSSERTFPVTVDPAIYTTAANTADTYIYSGSPSTSYGSDTIMWTGIYNSNSSEDMTYWKATTLPTIPNNAYISSATLELYVDTCAITNFDEMLLGVYPVTNGWSESMTWTQHSSSSQGTLGDIYDCISVEDSQSGYYASWDITDIYRQWEDETLPNNGIAIKRADSFDGYCIFVSSEDTENQPKFTVNYYVPRGIESYWSYASHNVHDIGTGHVNLATGELTLNIPTISTLEEIFGFTPSLVYNSSTYDKYNLNSNNSSVPHIVQSAGYGWSLNVNESVVKKTYTDVDGTSVTYYVLTDSDGTEHAFYLDEDTDEYKDEDGLQLTLTVSGNYYHIEDSSHTVKSYRKISNNTSSNEGAVLNIITDKFGNKLKVYNLTNGRCNGIAFCPVGASDVSHLSLTYNTGGCISAITNSTSGHKVTFEYSETPTGTVSASYGGYLRKITFLKGTTAYSTTEITYASGGIIQRITDSVTGEKLHYKFSSNKMALVREQGDSYGQTIGITYGSETTTVRTSGSDDTYNNTDDILTHYTFDRKGRAISSYSSNVGGTTIYGATSGTYSEDNENRLKSQAVSGGNAVNYLINSNFEMTDDNWNYWYPSTNTTKVVTDNTYAKISPKASTTDGVYQNVKLDNGKYTLSANITSASCTGVTLYMKVTQLYPLSIAEVYSKEIPVSEKDIESKISPSLTFEVNNSNGYDYFAISIEAVGGSSVGSGAYVTVDDVMLEKGIGSSENSVINLGSFEDSCISDSSSAGLAPDEAWIRDNTMSTVIETGTGIVGNAAKLTGGLAFEQSIIQTIQILPSSFWNNTVVSHNNSPANFYLFSGFVKGTHQVQSGYIGFRVIANCYASNAGENGNSFIYEFPANNAITDYQFVSGLITVPEGNFVGSVEIQCVYDNNPGVAYFDDISLIPIKDSSAAEYEYTPEGYVSKCITPERTTYYSYDLSGNLVRQYDDYDNFVVNTYDENNALISTSSYVEYYIDNLVYAGEKITTTYTYNDYGLVTQTDTVSDQDLTKSIITSSTYVVSTTSKIFGKLLTSTDENGDTVTYEYDSNSGNLTYQLNPDGFSGLYYYYDSVGRLSSVTPLTVGGLGDFYSTAGAECASYTYNTLNQLSKISTATTDYTFEYDSFGNTTKVKAGNYTLATYVYNSSNGKLSTMTYGNGTVVRYYYDALDRISSISYNGSTRYEYQYTSDGKLHCVVDYASDVGYLYDYDNEDRISGYTVFDTDDNTNTLGIKYAYNDKNQIEQIESTLDYTYGLAAKDTVLIVEYYDYCLENDLLQSFDIGLDSGNEGTASDLTIDYTYDSVQRLTQRKYTVSGSTTYTNTVNLTYNDVSNKLSSQIKSYSTKINSGTATTYNYTYDANGNITRIVDNNSKITRYQYDDMGQLTREDNPYLNKTYVYTYDNNGNRTSKKTYAYTTGSLGAATSTQTYTYGDSTWGDRLTNAGTGTITYDDIGNPLMYCSGNNYIFTWTDGRRLTSAETQNGYSFSFTYNDEGIRTSKTFDGVKHTYTLDGSRIVSEQWGNHFIVYIYDEAGSPIGMYYRTNSMAIDYYQTYYFEKNLQGDVIAVYNSSGTKLVGYVYDAWGNFTTTYYNGGSSTAAQYNPFRYRGYYYDSDFEFYYLNSRYYDSKTGRFINPDDYTVIGATPTELTDKNLYAYCDNNPITRADDGGEFWNWIVGGVVGAVGGAISAIAQGKTGKDFWGAVANGAISGTLTGLCADIIVVTGGTAGVVIAVGALGGAMGNATGSITEDLITEGKINWADVGIDATFGAATGSLSGVMSGPQDAMMDVVKSRAGRKALEKGITVWSAVKKTATREINKLGASFIEETMSTFTFGLTSEIMKEKLGW